MDVKVVSSKLVKPRYPEGAAWPDRTEHVPFSVFDRITYHIHMAIIYTFSAPAPSTADIERGLADVLAVYRLFAGQVRAAPNGATGVLLNDRGVRLVEAGVDGATLSDAVSSKPTPVLLKLHPDLEGEIQEVVQVQLTRFACGSLAVGFTSNHAVADGRATCDFLAAWGRAARGRAIGQSSPPSHNNPDLFRPRHPPHVEFEHRGVEYHRPTPNTNRRHHSAGAKNIVTHKAHFSRDFIAGLRSNASEGRGHPFSRFETTLAHVWRTMTRARDLGAHETSTIRISVDGRRHLATPPGYFGNLVLWAFPRATAGELVSRPLKHAAQVIHDALARVDGAYFQSLVDFASFGAVEREGLEKTAVLHNVLCPDIELDSWPTSKGRHPTR